MQLTEKYTKIIPRTRIKAIVEVFIKKAEQSFIETIHQHSFDTDIVFMRLSIPKAGKEQAYARKLKELSDGLKTSIFVYNGEANVPGYI